MTDIARLEASKARLRKAFDELEKGIKNLKKKQNLLDKNLVEKNSALNTDLKQLEGIFFATLNKINSKLLEIKKLELV
jgi:hypothetical protein